MKGGFFEREEFAFFLLPFSLGIMAICLWLNTGCAGWRTWFKVCKLLGWSWIAFGSCFGVVWTLQPFCVLNTFSVHCFDSSVFSQLWKCLSQMPDVWKVLVFIKGFLLASSFLGVLKKIVSPRLSFINIGTTSSSRF